MLFDLIAAVAAAFCAGGVMLILRHLLRGRLPPWCVPAAAGLGMLSYAIWSEYSWSQRALGSLPESFVLVSEQSSQAWYRPWTLLVPQVDRLVALDRASQRRHPAQPGQVLSRVVLMARWQPTREFAAVFDCSAARRADLLDEVSFGEEGKLLGARWIALAPEDPLLRAACLESGAG
jgi:hypothetical protein